MSPVESFQLQICETFVQRIGGGIMPVHAMQRRPSDALQHRNKGGRLLPGYADPAHAGVDFDVDAAGGWLAVRATACSVCAPAGKYVASRS